MSAPQNLSFIAGTPELERFEEVRINMVMIGPGLPSPNFSGGVPEEIRSAIGDGEGAVLIRSPEDQGNCNYISRVAATVPVEVQNGRCLYTDMVGNLTSFVMFGNVLPVTTPGDYRFAMYNAMNTTAKAW